MPQPFSRRRVGFLVTLGLSVVTLFCAGCFVVPDTFSFPVPLRGVVRSSDGKPLQDRVALLRAGKRGLHADCRQPFAADNACVVAVSSPGTEGQFEFRPLVEDDCLLWLLPPLGILPCDRRDYFAVALESSPDAVGFVTIDFRTHDVTSFVPRKAAGQRVQIDVRNSTSTGAGRQQVIQADLVIVRP